MIYLFELKLLECCTVDGIRCMIGCKENILKFVFHMRSIQSISGDRISQNTVKYPDFILEPRHLYDVLHTRKTIACVSLFRMNRFHICLFLQHSQKFIVIYFILSIYFSLNFIFITETSVVFKTNIPSLTNFPSITLKEKHVPGKLLPHISQIQTAKLLIDIVSS